MLELFLHGSRSLRRLVVVTKAGSLGHLLLELVREMRVGASGGGMGGWRSGRLGAGQGGQSAQLADRCVLQ